MSHPVVHIDRADREMIEGWGWDPARPDHHLRLALQEGDQVIALVLADLERADLAAAGIGRGDHAFSIHIPMHLRLGAVDDLRLVNAETGRELGRVRLPEPQETLEDLAGRLQRKLAAELAASASSDRSGLAGQMMAQFLPALEAVWADLQPASAAPPAPGSFAAALEAVLARYPRLVLPRAEAPAISVIIPVYGQFALTYGCLRSLADLPDRIPFEVLLVDDGSSDETLLAACLVRHLRVLRNPENLGFVRSCNAGAAAARGTYLYFLNNDTEVEPGALEALVEAMEAEPRAGIVGAKLIDANGLLQEAGGIVFRLGDAANYGRGEDPADPRFNYRRDVDYISGASLLIRRTLFQELGGFDEAFAPAYYEDTDLCFRARAAGWRVIYQPRSVVRHLEGGTSGTDIARGAKRYQLVNGRKFVHRWRDKLAEHALSPARLEREKDREARLRLLFIDATVPAPGQDAGSAAALSHIRSLQRLGAKVTLVAASHLGLQEDDGRRLQDAGVEVLHHPFIWSVEEVLRRREGDFDAIYLHRAEVALRHLEICRCLAPNARILYSVADLHFLRAEREAALTDLRGPAFTLPGVPPESLRGAELAAAAAVDAVIVHSPVEAAMLQATGIETVVVAPWEIPLRHGAAAIDQRRGLLFVGGFRHAPNVDGILWFVQQVWPALRAARPDLTLSIVGSHMPAEVTALASLPGIDCLGHVPDLAPFYASHRLAIAPLRYGAGLKGKVIEALACGLPCVGTDIAYEGVEFGLAPSVSGVDAPALVEHILALEEDPALWMQVREAGIEHAAARYSEAAVMAALHAALGPLAARLKRIHPPRLPNTHISAA